MNKEAMLNGHADVKLMHTYILQTKRVHHITPQSHPQCIVHIRCPFHKLFCFKERKNKDYQKKSICIYIYIYMYIRIANTKNNNKKKKKKDNKNYY